MLNNTRCGQTERQRAANENIDPRLLGTDETTRRLVNRRVVDPSAQHVGGSTDNKLALGKERKAREENEVEEDEYDGFDEALDQSLDGQDTDERFVQRNLEQTDELPLNPMQTKAEQPRPAKNGKSSKAAARDDGPLPAKRKRATTYRTLKKKRAKAAEEAHQLSNTSAMCNPQTMGYRLQVANPAFVSSGFLAYQRQQKMVSQHQVAPRSDLRPGLFAPVYSVQAFRATPIRAGWNWCPALSPLAQYHPSARDTNVLEPDPIAAVINSMAPYRSPYPPLPHSAAPSQPRRPAPSIEAPPATIKNPSALISQDQRLATQRPAADVPAVRCPSLPANRVIVPPRVILAPANRNHTTHGKNVHWDSGVMDSRPRSGRYVGRKIRAGETKEDEALAEDEYEDVDMSEDEDDDEFEDGSEADSTDDPMTLDEESFSDDNLLPLDEELAEIRTFSQGEPVDPPASTSLESSSAPPPASVAKLAPTFSPAPPSVPVPSGAVVPELITIRPLFRRDNGPYPGPIQLPVVPPLNALTHFLMFDPVPSVEFNRALGLYDRLLLWSTADTAAEATLREFWSWIQAFDRNEAAMNAAGRGVTELWQTRPVGPVVVIEKVHVSESSNWYEHKAFEAACWKYCLDNDFDRTYGDY